MVNNYINEQASPDTSIKLAQTLNADLPEMSKINQTETIEKLKQMAQRHFNFGK